MLPNLSSLGTEAWTARRLVREQWRERRRNKTNPIARTLASKRRCWPLPISRVGSFSVTYAASHARS